MRSEIRSAIRLTIAAALLLAVPLQAAQVPSAGVTIQADGARRVVVARAKPSDRGPVRFARTVVSGVAHGVYPALAAAADTAVVIAWTEGAAESSTIHVAVLR